MDQNSNNQEGATGERSSPATDFIQGQLTRAINSVAQLNRYNNPSIPVLGLYTKNIFKNLYAICYDIQKLTNNSIYNPFSKDDSYWFQNQLYSYGNQITLQNLQQYNVTLDLLTDVVSYIQNSTYQNPKVDELSNLIGRLRYAIQFVTRYLNDDDPQYGYVMCDPQRTRAQYGYNSLSIWGEFPPIAPLIQ